MLKKIHQIDKSQVADRKSQVAGYLEKLDLIHTFVLIIRMTDTKQKILDAAEELFGEKGYSATSMRNIISTAAVNLAAIHYHFGSKQDLLDHVILRKLGPINERRIQLLDQFEAETASGFPPIEKILEAFLVPAILAEKNRSFIKFMGRIHAEGLGQQAVMRNFQPLIGRFLSAFSRAFPNMPRNWHGRCTSCWEPWLLQ